jgi:hypothetical protein
VLQVGEAEGIEGPESVRRPYAHPPDAHGLIPSSSLGSRRPSHEMHRRRVRREAGSGPDAGTTSRYRVRRR